MKRIIAEKDRILKTGEIKKIDKFAPVKSWRYSFFSSIRLAKYSYGVAC